MDDAARHAAPEYAVIVRSAGGDWAWEVRDPDGAFQARGADPDQGVAWRSGLFVAGALGALRRIGRRRF